MLKAAREDLMSTVFRVILEGSQEVPSRDTTASGVGTVVFDSAEIAASYSFDIQGLDFGPITSGQKPTDPNDVNNTHFHAQVRGVIGSVVFGQIVPAHDIDGDLAFVLNADGSWSESGRWETTDVVPITNSFPDAAPGLPALPDDTFANVLGSATVGSEVQPSQKVSGIGPSAPQCSPPVPRWRWPRWAGKSMLSADSVASANLKSTIRRPTVGAAAPPFHARCITRRR